MRLRDRLMGPRVPEEELAARPAHYRRPAWLFAVAAILLVVSSFLPYWRLYLKAPQYPQGLQVRAYLNRLVGDVVELEGLNHYVGLPSFEEGATFERSIAVIAIVVIAGLVLAAVWVHNRNALWLALPALLFPVVFLADLQFWLWKYGHSLDPRAPFSNAVGEFTPPILGPAEIAQFNTLALPGWGLAVATAASIVTGIALWLHRQAYKPLVEGGVETAGAGDGDPRS